MKMVLEYFQLHTHLMGRFYMVTATYSVVSIFI